jgi:hypothetical protein
MSNLLIKENFMKEPTLKDAITELKRLQAVTFPSIFSNTDEDYKEDVMEEALSAFLDATDELEDEIYIQSHPEEMTYQSHIDDLIDESLENRGESRC